MSCDYRDAIGQWAGYCPKCGNGETTIDDVDTDGTVIAMCFGCGHEFHAEGWVLG